MDSLIPSLLMDEELQTYLNTIAKNECYVSEKVLKETSAESTEVVMLHNQDGSIEGPFIRKQILAENSLGLAYKRIWKAQQEGLQLSNIPRIYDYSELNEKRFVVMEYLPGKTLEELISIQVLSQEQIYSIFFDVCRAVTELHEKFYPAIIHRDLKPSNIMISNGKAMLIDFGIARSFQQEAETDTQHFGTRSFAPPEQFGFSQTDQRSDEYALAALLFYCLSKRVPTSKDRDQHFTDPSIKASVSNVLNKAMSLDPSARFETVSDFSEEIKRALSSTADVNANAQSFSLQTEPQQFPAPGAYAPPNYSAPTPSWQISEARTISTKPAKNPNRFFRLKVAWDVLVVLSVLVILFGCIMATFFPSSTEAISQMSLEARILTYITFFIGWILPISYLISARAPFLKLFKIQKKPSLLAEIGVAALLMFSTLIIMAVIANTMT